jgi:hypothetical protein
MEDFTINQVTVILISSGLMFWAGYKVGYREGREDEYDKIMDDIDRKDGTG